MYFTKGFAAKFGMNSIGGVNRPEPDPRLTDRAAAAGDRAEGRRARSARAKKEGPLQKNRALLQWTFFTCVFAGRGQTFKTSFGVTFSIVSSCGSDMPQEPRGAMNGRMP